MCVGMLARRLIIGELHAHFVAYALAPEIPVEVIVGHAKLPKQKNDREERSRCPSSGRYLARNAAFYPSGTLPVLLDHAIVLRLGAEMGTRAGWSIETSSGFLTFQNLVRRTSSVCA